jgi:hypothetical protein
MFQNSVICMPAFARPEMLALSLERIDQAVDAPDDVRIFLDTSSDERLNEVEYVVQTYLPRALIFHAKPHVSVPSGMFNILSALKSGWETGAEFIFLLEEDVLINPKEFFSWHREAQNDELFATCGRKIPHLPNYDKYTNPGSCFSRAMLALVVPHIKNELFENKEMYYEKNFGSMKELSTLDDGMIRRIAKFHQLQVKYPDTPKCAHIGFKAYNHYMDWTNEGNIQERILKLREMLKTVDRTNRYTGDFESPVIEG